MPGSGKIWAFGGAKNTAWQPLPRSSGILLPPCSPPTPGRQAPSFALPTPPRGPGPEVLVRAGPLTAASPPPGAVPSPQVSRVPLCLGVSGALWTGSPCRNGPQMAAPTSPGARLKASLLRGSLARNMPRISRPGGAEGTGTPTLCPCREPVAASLKAVAVVTPAVRVRERGPAVKARQVPQRARIPTLACWRPCSVRASRPLCTAWCPPGQPALSGPVSPSAQQGLGEWCLILGCSIGPALHPSSA